MGAASAVDTHVTYEILLSGGRDARGSGFGAAQRRAEVRVSSHLGAGGARLLHIRRANLYRPARDTGSGANVWREDTHSACEPVSTSAGYRFGCERVSSGYKFRVRMCTDLRGIQLRVRTCGEQIHIRRPNVYRRASRQATRYRPYFATACRMRAPHGTPMAARKPTVAAPCRQSHGRPAAYAATTVGQVMGST